MLQSVSDAKSAEIPILAYRKDNDEWKIEMRASDWFEFYKKWEAGQQNENNTE